MRFAELDAQLHRALSIIKVRDSDHDPALQALNLGPKGISLARAFDGASGVLSGSATTPGDR
jgi:circadian clock protein KaiC